MSTCPYCDGTTEAHNPACGTLLPPITGTIQIIEDWDDFGAARNPTYPTDAASPPGHPKAATAGIAGGIDPDAPLGALRFEDSEEDEV